MMIVGIVVGVTFMSALMKFDKILTYRIWIEADTENITLSSLSF